MNIQLGDQRIRFRLTAPEFEKLLGGMSIFHRLILPEGQTLELGVKSVDRKQALFLVVHEKSWWLEISEESLQSFSRTLPSRDGLSHHQPVVAGAENRFIEVVFEVDAFSRKEE